MNTVSRHRLLVGALAALVVVVSALVPTGPALAYGGAGADSTGTQSGRVGTCYASAGPNYLGLRCISANGLGADRKTPSDILCSPGKPDTSGKPGDPVEGGRSYVPNSGPNPPKGQACDPVPDCWYRPLNTEEQQTLGKFSVEEPGGVVYYWQRCLVGISKDRTITGPIRVDQTPAVAEYGKPVLTLTQPQTTMVEYFFHGDDNTRTPPAPKGSSSPSVQPRVRTDVSFYDAASLKGGGTVSVRAGGVRLMAVEEYADVTPRPNVDSFRCDRKGSVNPNSGAFDENATVGYQAQSGEDRKSTPDGCWYEYTRSSADQPGNNYHGEIVSHWSVWSSEGDGQWVPFAPNGGQVQFDKRAGIDLAVTEVQSINVLPDGDDL